MDRGIGLHGQDGLSLGPIGEEEQRCNVLVWLSAFGSEFGHGLGFARRSYEICDQDYDTRGNSSESDGTADERNGRLVDSASIETC